MQLAIHTEQAPKYASKRVKHKSNHRWAGGRGRSPIPLRFKR
jgi:hypothetical protein